MDEYLIYDYGDVELSEQEYFDCLMCKEIEEAKREMTDEEIQTSRIYKKGVIYESRICN